MGMERSRRTVLSSLPPLWLIGVCVFLPMVRACQRMESPASLIAEGPLVFSGLLAPFVVAELMAILGIVALARGRLTPLVTRATFLLVVLTAASGCIFVAIALAERGPRSEHLWGALSLSFLVAGAAVLVRAWRRDGWARQAELYRAYTLFALPLAVELGRIVIAEDRRHVGIGAVGYLVAVAALAIIHSPRRTR
jgi:hypothetical protein